MAGIAHWDISAELFDSLSYPLGLVVVVIVLLESNSALAAAFRHCLLYVRWTGVLERTASWGALACSLQRVPCVLVVNVCVLGVVVLAAVTSGCVRVRGLANRLLPWRLRSAICLARLWRDVGVVAVVGVVVVVGDVGDVVGWCWWTNGGMGDRLVRSCRWCVGWVLIASASGKPSPRH